jgi:cellulose synthase/poly-beta-1,6-N-acetylglucosamine synthase-like glycosyltransferase
MIQGVFRFLVLLILYVYFGYPLLLLALSKLRTPLLVSKADITPTVSLIIPAFNEEKVIAQEIENSLVLDYPKEKLEIIVVSDGSTDKTNDIVRTFKKEGVKLIALNPNQGKSSAQNRGVAEAHGEILFFTDANVMLRRDTVWRIVSNFKDDRVGCVVGKVSYLNERDTSVSEGEGFYWRYELFLRSKESELGNFAMGSGPIMAIRRNLFKPLDPNVGEDFVLPMQVAMKGYRVVYEPEAISEEVLFQNTPVSMFKSKVRVISKDLRGLFLCRKILNPFCYPLYAWGLISHKLLRWLVPYFLITIFLVNLFLLDHPFYSFVLALQIAFYGLAIMGYLWQKNGKPPRVLGLPFSFCLVNLAALVGVARFVLGRKSGRWHPVR